MTESRQHEIDPRRFRMASDPYRPAYHFLAPVNWMNDPNGTLFWNGRYHVFYQYNPNGAFHGTIHWGHASTEDLVHWTDHPIALAPGPEGADRDQCYSGAAFIDKMGVPTFIYHGLPDGICLAASADDMLLDWKKHPANPVIPNPQAGDEYRIGGAPCAWVEGDTCYALTGNSGSAPPDAAYLFSSRDLAHWEYLHPFYEGGRFTEWGEDCGCPDFFRLGDKHVLSFTSHLRGAQFYIGTCADHRFIPERHKRLARGETGRPGVYNEGLTLLDDRGRRILFGRLHEGRYSYVQRASGWAGMFALPMVLSLSDDGDLLMEPVPELEALRGEHTRVSNIELNVDEDVRLDGNRGKPAGNSSVARMGERRGIRPESLLFSRWGRADSCSFEPQSMVGQPCAARYRAAQGVDSGRKPLQHQPRGEQSGIPAVRVRPPLRQADGTAGIRGPERSRGFRRRPPVPGEAHISRPPGQSRRRAFRAGGKGERAIPGRMADGGHLAH